MIELGGCVGKNRADIRLAQIGKVGDNFRTTCATRQHFEYIADPHSRAGNDGASAADQRVYRNSGKAGQGHAGECVRGWAFRQRCPVRTPIH